MRNTRGQIYCIKNCITLKYYVGCSITYSSQRFNRIMNGAFTNNWGHSNLTDLQKDIVLFGKDNFKLLILERGVSDIETLYRKETEYILALKEKGNEVYNTKLNDRPEYHRQTEESIKRISEARNRLVYSEESKSKIRNANKKRGKY